MSGHICLDHFYRTKASIILLVAAICFFNIPSMAQKNFVEGYIVELTGDTIQGKIDYRNWHRTPETIRFMRNGSKNTITKLSPLDIASFYVNDEYYIAKILTLDRTAFANNELMVNMLTYSRDRVIQKDTVFLNVLVRGKLDLYFLHDDNDKPHYFVDNEFIEFDELILHQYLSDVIKFARVKTIIQRIERYKGQLTYYFKDCPELIQKAQKLKFNRKDITNIIYEYNDCK